MMKLIREGKLSKVFASYLAIQLLVQIFQPTAMWALTGGPKQPEFNSFTPIGTSDMVDLASGDFNYNIPIMDVGGYPLNLSYQSGVTMDQEASWVGLGWNLNVGQINRNVRGIPDDFKGDEMEYENNIKNNISLSLELGYDVQVLGAEAGDLAGFSQSTSLKYNNYTGISLVRTRGLAFNLAESVTAGVSLENSAVDGPTVSPNISFKTGLVDEMNNAFNGELNAGISYNSNRGLSDLSISASLSRADLVEHERKDGTTKVFRENEFGTSGSGRISFSTPTLTPRKRNAMRDIAGTLAVSYGPDIQGVDYEREISASAAVQKIKDNERTEKAYGYDFTGHASSADILDYNRENEQTISKSLKALPVTNYTYDTYSVQAQGIGGQFRPYRSQIGHINDEFVEDVSENFSLGVEIEGGPGFHVGANFTGVNIESYTGIWNTKAKSNFKQEREDAEEKLGYEPVYYKYVGEHRIDQDLAMFRDALGGDSPIELKISGTRFNKDAIPQYSKKIYETKIDSDGQAVDGAPSYVDIVNLDTIEGGKLKRKRDFRNQSIQKISRGDLSKFYNSEYLKPWEDRNKYGKDHHTAEMRVLKGDGSTYVFGETAYNFKKEETTFALDPSANACMTGLTSYSEDADNSINNDRGRDHFFTNTITPAYAHSYLLSAIHSTDYEDLTGNGPTEDDLGSYTKFEYQKKQEDSYNWRVPFEGATFNEGLNTDKKDEKGNYIYGEKEIKYIKQITTKTHMALFTLSEREDAIGVDDENGGAGDGRMYKLDKISLYSLPELKAAGLYSVEEQGLTVEPEEITISAIKTAFFEYSYDLCKNIPNNITPGEGKLTLDKVYFTYRDSFMGKYTPYTFAYDSYNPDYDIKSYDIWGNYKPNSVQDCGTQGDLSVSEFPFVDQENEDVQDQYASAWSMTSIGLPSGGKIDLEYETDDYQYVQDRDVLQMFKVLGVGDGSENTNDIKKTFYTTNLIKDEDHVYVKLTEKLDDINDVEEFKSKYLRGIEDDPIYFRFFMNMTINGSLSSDNSDYDYITGYFNIDGDPVLFEEDGEHYAAIPTRQVNIEGGITDVLTDVQKISPFSKAGLFFARRYLEQYALNSEVDKLTDNIEALATEMLNYFTSSPLLEFLRGPNLKLRGVLHRVARKFVPHKSWIRLSVPKTKKLGGGLRVKRLAMHDNWDKMLSQGEEYGNEYGQTYEYTLEDGSSSGVATYEPNSSAENPWVEPFYNDADDDLLAPRELNYVEKPFGASFFPGSKVTYSRVTVSNLEKTGVQKHATGKVVTEHFTTKEYPTKYDYTDLDPDYQTNSDTVLLDVFTGILGLPIEKKSIFSLSQGFVIRTNDMNGKMKSQKVFAEEAEDTILANAEDDQKAEPISSVEYKYSTKETVANELDNMFTVIHSNGLVETAQIGVDYDVVNDFRRSHTNSKTTGIKTNLALVGFPPFVLPIPTAFPTSITDITTANSAITTKVIHTTAIQTEKIATDLGATVTTTNEAWDAQTGQVLLTKTINEYDDLYYNFNMPAYWNYKNMGLASTNLGVKGTLNSSGSYYTYTDAPTTNDSYFTLGDELAVSYDNFVDKKLWVVGVESSGISLMDRSGNKISTESSLDFEIVRSGYRNQQMANMESLTLMQNPLENLNDGKLDTSYLVQNADADKNLKIVNASAVTYKDFWNCQCERGLKFIDVDPQNTDQLKFSDVFEYGFNPYLYNINGDWRADRSYAYLTERTKVSALTTTSSNLTNVRKEGYFKDYEPFYTLSGDAWIASEDESFEKWTYASEVTQFNSYGAEYENVDALGRHSSAQYGYNYTLPTAVASNTQYRLMGADNMEDYNFTPLQQDKIKEEPGERYNNLEDHFSFRKPFQDDDAVQLSAEFAHTGSKSLLVTSSSDANIVRPLVEELEESKDADGDGIEDIDDPCPYNDLGYNTDDDGDGVGNICDDDSHPEFYNLNYTDFNVYVNNNCYGRRARFTVQGKPNAVVFYSIDQDAKGNTGWWAHVNGESIANHNDHGNVELLQLDVTGQACVVFDVNARDGESSGFIKYKTIKNYPRVTFNLLDRSKESTESNRIFTQTNKVVTLEPVGLRDSCASNPSSIYSCSSY